MMETEDGAEQKLMIYLLTNMTLRDRILSYLRAKSEFVNGGELERLALEAGYKASNASRRCRELCEDNLIERKEEKGRHAKTVWYKATSSKSVTAYRVEGRTVVQSTLY